MEGVSIFPKEPIPREIESGLGRYVKVEDLPNQTLFSRGLYRFLSVRMKHEPQRQNFLGSKKTEYLPILQDPEITLLTDMLLLSPIVQGLIEKLPVEQNAKARDLSFIVDAVRRSIFGVQGDSKKEKEFEKYSDNKDAFREGRIAYLLISDLKRLMATLGETIPDTDKRQYVRDQIDIHLDEIALARQTAMSLVDKQPVPNVQTNRQKIQDRPKPTSLFGNPSEYVKELDRTMERLGYVQTKEKG